LKAKFLVVYKNQIHIYFHRLTSTLPNMTVRERERGGRREGERVREWDGERERERETSKILSP